MNDLQDKQKVFEDFPVRDASPMGSCTVEFFIDFGPIMAAFQARYDATDGDLIAARRGGETVELSEALASLGL